MYSASKQSTSTWMPRCIKSSYALLWGQLGPWEWRWLQCEFRAALSLNPPHKQPSLVYNSERNSLGFWAGHGRSLWAPTVLHSPPVLCLVISPCGTVQRIHPGVGTWVPSSWPWAEVPSYSATHAFLGLPASESEWSGTGAGNGEGHYMGAEEDGRSRRPLPWALPGISTVLVPQFVNGSLQMNGLICLQTVGMNLSAGAGEQEGLSTAEHRMNESWTLPVPGEPPECSLSRVRRDWPHFQGESREGALPVHTLLLTSTVLADYRRKECGKLTVMCLMLIHNGLNLNCMWLKELLVSGFCMSLISAWVVCKQKSPDTLAWQ